MSKEIEHLFEAVKASEEYHHKRKTELAIKAMKDVEELLQLRFITVTPYTQLNEPRTVHVRIGDIGAIEEQPDDSRKEYKTGIALKTYPDKVMLLTDTYDEVMGKIDYIRNEILNDFMYKEKEDCSNKHSIGGLPPITDPNNIDCGGLPPVDDSLPETH